MNENGGELAAGRRGCGRAAKVSYSGTCQEAGAGLGAAAVATVALAVRLAYIAETHAVPTLRHLVGDAAGYLEWGRSIAAGAWLGSEAFYQAPLYPYVLGAVIAAGGESVGTIRLVQAVWGSIAVGCLGVAATRLLGRGPGLLAGLMLALYPPAIFFDGVIQKASLAGLLTCVLLVLMSRRAPGAGPAAVIGAVMGLLVLTRENAAVWAPVLLAWMVVTGRSIGRSARLAPAAAGAAGMALVLLPVGARNLAVGGEWSLSTFQMGPNLYIGNRGGADGRYRPLVRGHETPAYERADATRLAEQATGRPMTPREVSRYWTGRALADIRADPAAWVGLMGRKFLMVWNRYEVADAESQYVYAADSFVLRCLGRVWHLGVLGPLAAVGLIGTWSERRRLWVYYVLIASMAAAVALFYVMARYRHPLVLLLIPFAAAGCFEVWRLAGRRAWAPLASRLALAGLVGLAVNLPIHDEPRLNALAFMNVGVALAEAGDLPAATPYFASAVERHPGSAEARNNLAQALALDGRYAEAIPHYRAALAVDPTLTGVDYNLAVALERLGRTAEALNHYRRGAALDPTDQAAAAAVRRIEGR